MSSMDGEPVTISTSHCGEPTLQRKAAVTPVPRPFCDVSLRAGIWERS